MMNANRSSMRLTAIALLALASATQPLMASGLHSSVSSTKIGYGESFELTLSIDSARATSAPDLAPLQKDFRILGTGQSSQVSIINGRRTNSFNWVITLTPNEKGKLEIPAIKAGNSSSEPLTIEVVDSADLPAGSPGAGEFSIELSAETGTHYVLEEIPITVRIRGEGGMREASLEEPAGNDFVLTQTGEDKVSHSTRNGHETFTIERQYLLKPQKSGNLTVPPLTLRATVDDPAATRSSIFSGMGFDDTAMLMPFDRGLFADMFNPGREITVRSNPLEIEVHPRPTADKVWFLPAKQVDLRANWSPASPEFRVGEAVTRRIQLFALGASGEQLPDIPVSDTDGARLYLDRSSTDTTDTPDGTAAVREFDVSVVPTRAGEVSLPPISVTWWDTNADKERVETLPAQVIKVLPGVGQNAGNTFTATAAPTATNSAPEQTATDSAQRPGLPWLQSAARFAGYALMAVILLACVLLVMRRRRNLQPGKSAPAADAVKRPGRGNDSAGDIAALERDIVRACKADDLQRAYAALSKWMLRAPGSVSPEFTQELAAMEKQLYAGTGDSAWRGTQMLKLFLKDSKSRHAAAHAGSNRNNIPALYPG